MSAAIAVAKGRFAMLLSDTRMLDPHDRDLFHDVGFHGLATPSAGLQIVAEPNRRKIAPTPGPAWVCGTGTGGAVLQHRLVLNSLTGYGVANLETVKSVLRQVPLRASELAAEWGYSKDAVERQLTDTTLSTAIVRPGPKGPEIVHVGTRIEPRIYRTAMILPPTPLGASECRMLMDEHLEPVGKRRGENCGLFVLAAAAVLEHMGALGGAVSPFGQVGLLYMDRDRTLTAQINFDAATLLEEWSAPELDERLRELFFDGSPTDSWDPDPVWLTEEPVLAAEAVA